jgi:glycosyltransferase involved in cell wall biosynthesis
VGEQLKVNILFPFREGPWGGSNQFLSALRQELRRVDAWAPSPAEADVVLFDSFNNAADVIAWKLKLPNTPFVQRIDGPVSRYRGGDRHVDELIHALGSAIADGIIFQSSYSERANLALGMAPPGRATVILNAPGADYAPSVRHVATDKRVRLVASSWSANWNKGFEVYRHLDGNLDFSRYHMTFVGNSPIDFRNIEHVPPRDSAGLAELLHQGDIYVTASIDDPCSNSLIEAMASGLPAVALNSGGHPELLGKGGALFEGIDDVIGAIDSVAAQIDSLRSVLPVRSIAGTASEYLRFMESVRMQALPPRHLSSPTAWKLRGLLPLSRVRGKVESVKRQLGSPLSHGADKQHTEAPVKTIARKAYRLARGTQVAINCLLPRRAKLAVHYGGARVGDVGGPLVKVKRLSEHFPDHPLGFNLVYLLSNAPYVPAPALRLLKARNIPIVVNQNGVFYPGWYAGDWKTPNRIMGEAFHAADWVFYQSEFCRRAADKFLGERSGPGEVLYNAVDTSRFKPLLRAGVRRTFTFLITGKIGDHLSYRLESTIAGLAAARTQGLDARLQIAGTVDPGARRTADALADRLGVSNWVIFSGRYRQEDAPSIYGAADAYVMTKYNDPCPNTVLEALACGLPVLYSASGGVPELVGSDAGIGLDCGGENWDRPLVPTTEAIADGMMKIAQAPDAFASAARRRAVERFDISHWLDRHRAVFAQLLEAKS